MLIQLIINNEKDLTIQKEYKAEKKSLILNSICTVIGTVFFVYKMIDFVQYVELTDRHSDLEGYLRSNHPHERVDYTHGSEDERSEIVTHIVVSKLKTLAITLIFSVISIVFLIKRAKNNKKLFNEIKKRIEIESTSAQPNLQLSL